MRENPLSEFCDLQFTTRLWVEFAGDVIATEDSFDLKSAEWDHCIRPSG